MTFNPQLKKPHHKVIAKALQQINGEFLGLNNILFGGGTRIALELNEYRESIDLDFLCADKKAYRTVRQEVSSSSLGRLVRHEFNYKRSIRADRDAVRCFILINNIPIKLEFIAFADYPLTKDHQTIFEVPVLDRNSCFFTKLLANADRYNDKPYKDIFDILAMINAWGDIPKIAWIKAHYLYGFSVVYDGLLQACKNIKCSLHKYLAIATKELAIEPTLAQHLLTTTVQRLHQTLNGLTQDSFITMIDEKCQ